MDRVAAFEKLHFGMFIHFGLYSTVDRGEWIRFTDEKVRANYEQLFAGFNPDQLNWTTILHQAKQAGMKYVVLTCRHHDGFSLYDTKGLSDYDVMHTPYGHDIVADFTTACRNEGLVPFFYHTMHDWHHPLMETDFPAYLKYLRSSIEILCKNYGSIGGFWFDGMWSDRGADWQEDDLYGLIRQYQPDAIIINNSGLSKRGVRGHPQLDTITFEQGSLVPVDQSGFERHLAMEACQTMNKHWGSAVNDLDYKSPRQLIEMLAQCRKLGANYLLNVGPNGHGTLPLIQQALLQEIGLWTTYAGKPFEQGEVSTIKAPDQDFVIDWQNESYVFVHNLPMVGVKNVVETADEAAQRLTLTGLKQPVKSMVWLDDGTSVQFEQKGDSLAFKPIGFPYGTQLVIRIARITY
jgi:alpha-L-fucosidase